MNGTLFSGIAELPAGFADPFTVSVGGNILGQFMAGQSVNFQSFPGGAVSEFEIAGIDPLEVSLNLPVFPLKLAFMASTGSFSAAAVPEPSTQIIVILALLAFASYSCSRHSYCA